MKIKYKVKIPKKVARKADTLPRNIRMKFSLLVEDLENKGPYLYHWPNYGKLSSDIFHCHLSYHWVACWRYKEKELLIEIYYAGSRENAPY